MKDASYASYTQHSHETHSPFGIGQRNNWSKICHHFFHYIPPFLFYFIPVIVIISIHCTRFWSLLPCSVNSLRLTELCCALGRNIYRSVNNATSHNTLKKQHYDLKQLTQASYSTARITICLGIQKHEHIYTTCIPCAGNEYRKHTYYINKQ